MQLFEWKDEFNVGVLSVDQQHQQLVHILNQMHSVMKNGSRAAEVHNVLEELVAYTRFHFASEEKLMADCGYPAMDEHIRKHRAMEKRVGEFVAELSRNAATTPPKLFAFLKDWLARHILETDKELGRYLVKAPASR